MSRIALAYIGVHQIFQLALAAHEIGELAGLRCSMVNLPGKWGSRFPRVPSVTPPGYRDLPADRIHEHPWPLIAHRVIQRLLPRRRSDHLHSNGWFDAATARWLQTSSARLFVGGETCALQSFRAAKSRGMTTILDCAGIPNQFLDQQAVQAAKSLGFNLPAASNSPAMEKRKKEELELADHIFCCSEFQAEKLIETGANRQKVRVIPLWAPELSLPKSTAPESRSPDQPLRVIYAGAISLRKGVPYLIEAMNQMGASATLTLVGKPSPEMRPQLASLPAHCSHLEYMPKVELLKRYQEHDVLVMPSLGDSFGFVIMEAMACGLPVIASANSGAPLPASSWRVPAGNAAAIAERLRHYLNHNEALNEDRQTARVFASQWTPGRYRKSIQEVYRELLP